MSNEKIYAKGIGTFKKNDKAPDFVLGTLIITLDDFFQWCKEHPELKSDYQGKKQIKFQILKGQDGRINFPVDTYQPNTVSDTINNSAKKEQPKQDDGFVSSQATLDSESDSSELPF